LRAFALQLGGQRSLAHAGLRKDSEYYFRIAAVRSHGGPWLEHCVAGGSQGAKFPAALLLRLSQKTDRKVR
jgi:hypothetical protein